MKEFSSWYTEEVERLAEIYKEEKPKPYTEEEEVEHEYWESVMNPDNDLN